MSRAPMPASVSALMLSQQLEAYLKSPDEEALGGIKALFDCWVVANAREAQELRQQMSSLARRLDTMECDLKARRAA